MKKGVLTQSNHPVARNFARIGQKTTFFTIFFEKKQSEKAQRMAIQVMLDWVPWFFTAKVCLRFRYFWWSDLFSKKICFQKMYFFQ